MRTPDRTFANTFHIMSWFTNRSICAYNQFRGVTLLKSYLKRFIRRKLNICGRFIRSVIGVNSLSLMGIELLIFKDNKNQ